MRTVASFCLIVLFSIELRAQEQLLMEPSRIEVDLNTDGKVETITWRKLGEDQELGIFYQVLVKDASGTTLWKSPEVMKHDDPMAFGEFHFGLTLPQWAGDLDGDGVVELLVPAAQSDVSPCFFRVFRWLEGGFQPLHSLALSSGKTRSSRYAWTDSPSADGYWVQRWLGRSAEGAHLVEVVSMPENASMVIAVGVIQAKSRGFELLRWISPPMSQEGGDGVADEIMYRARLSAKDHLNSSGVALKSVLDVLLQDRANVHRHVHTDEEDHIDAVFTTPDSRQAMTSMTLNVVGGKGVEAKILSGTPLVEVRAAGGALEVQLISD